MAKRAQGVGLFTTENILAVPRVIPDTRGSCAAAARQHGVTLSPHTTATWVTRGRGDIRARKNTTAYARFAKQYDELRAEHCGPDANRHQEFNRALEALERTCECGAFLVVVYQGSPARAGKSSQATVFGVAVLP